MHKDLGKGKKKSTTMRSRLNILDEFGKVFNQTIGLPLRFTCIG